MKNRIPDLKNHLFAQLGRLSEEDMTPEKLDQEVKRATAMVGVADQIVKSTLLQVRAAELVSEYGGNPEPYLPSIENK